MFIHFSFSLNDFALVFSKMYKCKRLLSLLAAALFSLLFIPHIHRVGGVRKLRPHTEPCVRVRTRLFTLTSPTY